MEKYIFSIVALRIIAIYWLLPVACLLAKKMHLSPPLLLQLIAAHGVTMPRSARQTFPHIKAGVICLINCAIYSLSHQRLKDTGYTEDWLPGYCKIYVNFKPYPQAHAMPAPQTIHPSSPTNLFISYTTPF